MLRAALTAIALGLLPACAHAQSDPAGNADLPIARATANVIIQALPPNEYGMWRNNWDAVSIRVSRFVHWQLYAPDPIDRPPDAISRRNGWIEGEGQDVDVSAQGTDDRVTMLTFEYTAFNTLDLLAALRAEGADVSFQADYESYSEYVVTPPGREGGLLTTSRVCSSPQSRAAQSCHNEAVLAFELP